MLTFQEVILRLQQYWNGQGCALLQPIDIEVGAGTSHTATFLRALGPEPWRAAYVQPSRRPKDARYGENPNRLHQHHQFQVVLKPAPTDIVDRYLGSLRALGIDTEVNDIRFVEDNWENPTLGAWGLGWEVWMNGMEVTQFTYFQQIGGLECKPITGEITYGLERLTMYLQNCDNVFDLVYTKWQDASGEHILTYGDVFHQNEVEQSHYNFEASDPEKLLKQFDYFESEAKRLMGEDPSLRAALVEAFGDETFRDGVLNRRYLAATVFGDRHALARLEALVHPCVKRDFERWAAERTAEPYVVLECAILYESGMDAAVDRVVAVVAPEELRLVRVNARDGASAAEIRRRMAAQLSDDVLSARADYTIVNINREDLAADVAECDRRFRYEAAGN